MRILVALWRQASRGVHSLFNRRSADRDINDEVQDYLERAAAGHIATGASNDDALRAARLELGNVTVARETVRAYGWENVVDGIAADVRYALRRLRKNPAFTTISVLTLALGIGSATAIFSAINPILLASLPYPGADRLVTVSDLTDDATPQPPTFGTFVELRSRSHSFEYLAATDQWQPSLTETTEPERLHAQRVTANYFRTLGVEPAIGRAFDEAEDQPGGPNIVILSERLAARRFGGAQAVVGRRVALDGDSYTVIGVMPRGFANVLAPAADAWAPMQARANAPFESREWGHHYQIIGRLAAGTTPASAKREIATIGRSPSTFARPQWADWHDGLLIRALQEDIAADAKPILFAITGAALLLLMIAAVNVTNLLMTRGVQRRTELAMRIALGANRARLVRQLVTESLLTAVLGGVLGLGIAAFGVKALVALSPPGLPRVDAIRLDAAAFLFALAAASIVGLAVGVVPAIGAIRISGGALAHGDRRATAGVASGFSRRTLVVTEVALALILLTGAGLLMRSLKHLLGVEPGLDPRHLLTMQVIDAGHSYNSDAARQRFFDEALDAVRNVPGVSAAAFTSQLPLSGDLDAYGYALASKPSVAPGGQGAALRYAVTPGYFEAMHIPTRAGRVFDASDRAGAPEVVILSESFARREFGNSNPIGQRVQFGPDLGRPNSWRIVVGVVGDVKQASLASTSTTAFYVPAGQWSWVDAVQSLTLRTTGNAATLAPAIKRAIWSVDRNQPIQRILTMDDLVAASAADRRFSLAIIETFAIAALLLAAIGLYGVIAATVAERTREIAIRAALGAAPRRLVGRVVGGSMILTTCGIALGLAGAVAATRLLESLLFGISHIDPLTYASVVSILIAISVLASWAPARRAARVDPAITLRTD